VQVDQNVNRAARPSSVSGNQESGANPNAATAPQPKAGSAERHQKARGEDGVGVSEAGGFEGAAAIRCRSRT